MQSDTDRSFNIIRSKYQAMYPGEPSEADGWLNNNILRHMNNYQPSISGFTKRFMDYINRGEDTPIIDGDTYLSKLDTLTCEYANYILWKKMLPNERDEFIRLSTLH